MSQGAEGRQAAARLGAGCTCLGRGAHARGGVHIRGGQGPIRRLAQSEERESRCRLAGLDDAEGAWTESRGEDEVSPRARGTSPGGQGERRQEGCQAGVCPRILEQEGPRKASSPSPLGHQEEGRTVTLGPGAVEAAGHPDGPVFLPLSLSG